MNTKYLKTLLKLILKVYRLSTALKIQTETTVELVLKFGKIKTY